ncbi:DMP19 family protein [Montanilutibacter psychrotolerans]|uniref:DNA mimic protein DMP19 C-terminal domain-containing protein n=1 Tax=Montanilutibacter psychrotolerans TaxID=1327343 RepID=A0A3M8SR47_9GAMM|nr:hypothetical protein [Lysobacter psychrotolerans]RNF83243.1 hypothetical protein EER27_12165 [Lysobacter psychrotolerans]
MTTLVTAAELAELAEQIHLAIQERGGERPPLDVEFVSLAGYFSVEVTKGGFAQLLYNLQGEYLGEIEQMLVAAPAPVAHAHYAQAIRACLDVTEDYQAFLASDYLEPNALRDTLHGISVAYFSTRVEFLSEMQDFIQRTLGAVHEWVQAPADS